MIWMVTPGDASTEDVAGLRKAWPEIADWIDRHGQLPSSNDSKSREEMLQKHKTLAALLGLMPAEEAVSLVCHSLKRYERVRVPNRWRCADAVRRTPWVEASHCGL